MYRRTDLKPINPIQVYQKMKDEPIDRMIKRFRKKVVKSNILKEYVSRMFYEKPSDKKRREQKINTNRVKREEEERLEFYKETEMDKRIQKQNNDFSRKYNKNTGENNGRK